MKSSYERTGLISGFMISAEKYPDRPALVVDNQTINYKELAQKSLNIAKFILANKASTPLVALLGYRSLTAYAGILGILSAGKGYVPLNPNFPIDRIYSQLKIAECNVVIVGSECYKVFKSLLPLIEKPLTVIFPDLKEGAIELEEKSLIHQLYFLEDAPENNINMELPEVDPESTAYLLFTSGSTGVPKGVAVTHNNVKSFVDYICEKYAINEHDRFSQTADINFDLSVLEIFPCWERGACLCCLPKESVMAPAKYINDKRLTVWISVPSVGIFMTKMRLLKPGAFPTLRYCMFCGEPLLQDTAEKWRDAAPNSVVVNFYGPTEATVAITEYKLQKNGPRKKYKNGIVPIGWTFEGQHSCLIDHEFNVVQRGEKGEICLSGSQVTKGYFNNREKSIAQYVNIPSLGEQIWYRTGDIVSQDEDGCMHYIGRLDNQVKIQGYRIELQEIDCFLREASGSKLAVSIAWPVVDGNAQGIIGIISGGDKKSKEEIIDHCKRFLPVYMVPTDLFFLETMPTNANGKIDKLEITNIIKEKYYNE